MTLVMLGKMIGSELKYIEVPEINPHAPDGATVWHVCFPKTETKTDGILRSAFGTGSTKAMARIDYANEIRGKLLVLNAYKSSRRSFLVPVYLTT